jgi:hypothetical protein
MLAAMEQAFGFKAAPGPIGPAEISLAVPPGPVPANPPADFSLDRPDVQPTSSTEARPTDESINHPELSSTLPACDALAQRATAAAPASTVKCEISNPQSSSLPPVPTDPPHSDHNPLSCIQHPEPSIQPPSPRFPGKCGACGLPLPPLLKNGERPIPVCPRCTYPVTPSWWTNPDYPPLSPDPAPCDVCRQRHQLDPNGLPDPCSQCAYYLQTHPPHSASTN